ncbi:pyruvate kinase [Marinobacter halophilus]|uniref:pyruvate kinase n=1 Tax=Marinobacter halophilus TaxID=1323740 RepID=A0A2T1K9R1_9GAMM|nr:pyruvate kinase [Marinobacter halophilus]PSF06282.1 pyruvate kinase [Marinobacter halophilus]GGC71264.1 pyruvate kinase [Marinobacter halophilus]
MEEVLKTTLSPSEIEGVGGLLEDLKKLRESLIRDTKEHRLKVNAFNPAYELSAENLLYYMSLRRHDIRPIQQRLAALGLSSLGRSESCVLSTLDAVIRTLAALLGQSLPESEPGTGSTIDIQEGPRVLTRHTDQLLGPAANERSVRIMVTMPTEAAHDGSIIHNLLAKGMNCMRVNCAHDSPEIWRAMIRNLRQAEQTLGADCRVFMDLGGPKIRTGEIKPEPAVVHVRPKRNAYGITVTPARIWLTPNELPSCAPDDCEAQFQVPARFLNGLRQCDEIALVDARRKSRQWAVSERTDEGCWLESTKACYVVPGTKLHLQRQTPGMACCDIGEFPLRPGFILLKKEDALIVTAQPVLGHAESRDGLGNVLSPATVSCTMPEVVFQVRPGDSIWFDDGKIGGVIEKVEDGHFSVKITHARPGGTKLRGGKGINLPDSRLNIEAVTQEDINNLAFIAEHADAVEMSFANSAQDVLMLETSLETINVNKPAIVLKIETQKGFENLPSMLLAAMRWPNCGVMIARGDLAVECGYERLAEVQEEILSVCEAAHVPVIWATQVLENLAQKGLPSRAEISDVVMAHRAECVMLNKGPHILEAVEALDNILKRMQNHQRKKRAMLRELKLAHMKP